MMELTSDMPETLDWARCLAGSSAPCGGGPSRTSTKRLLEARARSRYWGAETVRVDFEREARETTRTPEIAKEVSWKEQVRVWADNTTGVDSEHLDRALTFADELQREMRDTGMVPTPRRWRLEGLSLRGAIGVHRGTGLDEIELDLTKFEPGIIGITGANGCLSGDTLIDVPRDLSEHPHGIPIKDLVGTDPLVYAYDGEQIVLTRARDVRLTGAKRPVLRVRYTSNGGGRFRPPTELVGTPEHPVMLRDGTYKPLGKLEAGDSLMPLYRRIRDGQYVWINRNDGTFALEHRMVAGAVRGRPLSESEHGHHRDRNTINNSGQNIEPMSVSDHLSMHGQEHGPPHYDVHPRGMLGKEHDPAIKAQIAESMRRQWADPGNREKTGRGKSCRRAPKKGVGDA